MNEQDEIIKLKQQLAELNTSFVQLKSRYDALNELLRMKVDEIQDIIKE